MENHQLTNSRQNHNSALTWTSKTGRLGEHREPDANVEQVAEHVMYYVHLGVRVNAHHNALAQSSCNLYYEQRQADNDGFG